MPPTPPPQHVDLAADIEYVHNVNEFSHGMIGNLEHSSSGRSWFSGYICRLYYCCCRHLFIFLVSGYVILFLWDVAPVLCGWSDNQKQKGWDIPSGFLDWTLRSFFLIPAKRERRREKWQRALKKTTPKAQQAHLFFRLSGNIAGASLSFVTYCCKRVHPPGRLFLKSIQNMQTRNSGGDKGSQFPENDLTLYGICSNDFLNVFTRRWGEIWHLPHAAAPQKKPCRKLEYTNFALHQ